MKKAITFILICSLLPAFLSGCSFANDFFGKNEQDKEDNIDANVDKKNEAPREKGIPIDKESDLIESIFEFLHIIRTDPPYGITDLYAKLGLIEENFYLPLDVEFSSSDFYYVCGYDNNYTGNPNDYSEDRAKQCDWYKFNSPRDIPEYINNERWTFIFQINKASSVIDLMESGSAPNMAYSQWFEPEFKDGYNVATPITINKSIIYLCKTEYLSTLDEGTVYYFDTDYEIVWEIIRFVELDGVKYTTILTKQVFYSPSNPGVTEISPELALGEYYDDFADMIEINKHSIDRGYFTEYFSCIKIDDLIKVMKEIISDQS